VPSVREIWKTKSIINTPAGDGKTLSPASAVTTILGDVENLPDDIEILKADQAAIRTEVASLRENLAAELAPAVVEAVAAALKDGVTEETLISAAEKGVRRVLGSLDPDPTLGTNTGRATDLRAPDVAPCAAVEPAERPCGCHVTTAPYQQEDQPQ